MSEEQSLPRHWQTVLVECNDFVGAGLALATCMGYVLEGPYTEEDPYFRKFNGTTFKMWQTRKPGAYIQAFHIREIGCGYKNVTLTEGCTE